MESVCRTLRCVWGGPWLLYSVSFSLGFSPDVKDGVIVESEGTQTASSTLKQGHCDHLPTLLYEHFTKVNKSDSRLVSVT